MVLQVGWGFLSCLLKVLLIPLPKDNTCSVSMTLWYWARCQQLPVDLSAYCLLGGFGWCLILQFSIFWETKNYHDHCLLNRPGPGHSVNTRSCNVGLFQPKTFQVPVTDLYIFINIDLEIGPVMHVLCPGCSLNPSPSVGEGGPSV